MGAIHICLSGNLACSGVMPCAECHGARSQVLARAFMLTGGPFVDRATVMRFFEVYGHVWQDFQAQVLAAVPQVPPTLNAAEPSMAPGGTETMPAPPSVPPTPPVGMNEGPKTAPAASEPPMVAEEERDMMAPMTQEELDALMRQAQQPLPVEGTETADVVAAPVEEKPEPSEKAQRPDPGSKREGNEGAFEQKEGTT